MILYRFLLAIVVSIGTLLTALCLDTIFASFPTAAQYLFQIPILVIVIDEGRRLILEHGRRLGLSELDINGCFFFAAPMAAFGSFSLFKSLERILRS